MDELQSGELPGHGRVWACRGQVRDLPKLATEVEEYFEMGLEVRDGATIVDVGANLGLFAMAAAARARDLRIVAIEPIPALHAALARNFEQNERLRRSGVRPRLLRCGLSRSPEEHEVEFAYSSRLASDSTRHLEDKRVEFDRAFLGYGSALGRAVGGRLPGALGRGVARGLERFIAGIPRRPISRRLFERAIGYTRVRCPMTTLARVLDELGGPVDVLKIDVEGAELDVLHGARAEQWAGIRSVVLEANDLDGRLAGIRAFLAERGLGQQSIAEPSLGASLDLRSFLLLATR